MLNLILTIPSELAQQRLDVALVTLLPEHSRSRIQQWINQKMIRVNNAHWKASEKVQGGEQIEICAELEQPLTWQAEANIQLNIVYEDDALLIINKPRGLVVHPAAGNMHGTLSNALLHHAPELSQVPRAGIVHRLDKDTSGLLVVARTPTTHTYLVDQLQQRLINREYETIVCGHIISGDSIHTEMGRHPTQRTKMAVVNDGKPAITHYRVLERFQHYTRLQVKLETGRTHQIRVHMTHIRHPIVGDPVYGGRLKLPPQASTALIEALRGCKQQMLHAKQLGLVHPLTQQPLSWEQPVPEDMQQLLATLRQHDLSSGNAIR